MSGRPIRFASSKSRISSNIMDVPSLIEGPFLQNKVKAIQSQIIQLFLVIKVFRAGYSIEEEHEQTGNLVRPKI